MKKLKLLSLVSITPIAIAPIASSCATVIDWYSPNTTFKEVHKFINERSFTICDAAADSMGGWSGVFGTMWLFYHETFEKAKNKYTYYALTNNHVTSGFNESENKDPTRDWNIYFGFQNSSEAASKSNRINEDPICDEISKSIGKDNYYSRFSKTSHAGITHNDNFKPLFTVYIDAQGYGRTNIYCDLTIVRVDFTEFTATETDIKNRLDGLNDYADNHNNYLVEFDNYSNTNSTTMYCGGFPLVYMGDSDSKDPNYIYDDTRTKFQAITFEDVSSDIYSNMSSLINTGKKMTSSDDLDVYDATNTYDYSGGLFSPDWIGKPITDEKTPFGGGASGSLAIRASDVNDVNTYRASGIYWGGMSSSFGDWYFNPHFSPFVLNFGKNVSETNNSNIIKAFFGSDAYNLNKATNYPLYTQ